MRTSQKTAGIITTIGIDLGSKHFLPEEEIEVDRVSCRMRKFPPFSMF